MSDTKTAGSTQDKIDFLLGGAPAPMKKWRCSRGHKWESPTQIAGVAFQSYADIGIPSDKFCVICLYERCRDGLGRVREDV